MSYGEKVAQCKIIEWLVINKIMTKNSTEHVLNNNTSVLFKRQ